ncbi:hypothetical protein LTR05_006339 [Lithohypha guttulata]|uniref:Alpha/beta hydrolase fold-3 domain-containing protein n=1 Tax=Lithohypha guttulata TaxID=1690604 RepID=A0AAN7Y5N8_9EURO|nr:hypothetical protein LTR05_006339 [Lithohypha guttulata]
MEAIAELWQRMPEDLRQYLEEQTSLDDIPICEQEPADVASEVILVGAGQIKVYFPEFSHGKMVVFLHFPGGICKSGINRDQSWCSNLAKQSGSIHIAVDYPSAPTTGFRQILAECMSAVEKVRQLCICQWKETWNTDPTRIVLSGSSAGATLAIIIAAIAARNDEPVYGLIALVPLIDTDPNLAGDPWGDNENTVGLRPTRLLSDLNAAFNDDPRFRDHWHGNPYKMPDDVVSMLPRTIILSAKLDILYRSQSKFKERLRTRGVKVSGIEVDGLHQVKDMDQVTAAGRKARQYILRVSREFIKQAARSTDEGSGIVPSLQHIEALRPWDVRRLATL